MIGYIGIAESNNNWKLNHQLLGGLVFVFFTLLLNTFPVHTQKKLNQSQFTYPPVLPVNGNTSPVTTSHCSIASSKIEDAIHCFENQQFNQANKILQRVKRKAIKTRDARSLNIANTYLAFIAIETAKIRVAKKIIKHIFFLDSSFSLNSYAVSKRKYFRFFAEVKKEGRNINEIEFDEITKKSFIRVKSCTQNSDCKAGVWLEKRSHKAKNNYDTDLDCSLRGDCEVIINKNIDCSITGDCNSDLDCSLDGTC